MAEKLKIAAYSAAGCGGCEIALLEIHERILELTEAADIVFWPAIADLKYADLESMPDGAIDVCLFNGAILWSVIGGSLLSLIGLILLNTRDARAYFER